MFLFVLDVLFYSLIKGVSFGDQIVNLLSGKIGEKIKQKNGNIWEERIYVSLLEKLYFSLEAIYKLYFRKRLVFTTKVENKVIFILKKMNVRFD